MAVAEIRVNDGNPVVLLPADDARAVATAGTPDASNRWLWSHSGHALSEPAYGPPSLRIDSADNSAAGIYALRRMVTSERDTRPIPAGPARRWSVVVEHRHYVMALAEGVATLALTEPLAARWIGWRTPPRDWAALDAPIAQQLSAVRDRLAENASVLHTLPVGADTVCRLLGMSPRSDGAWTWQDGERTLHADGPPPFLALGWLERLQRASISVAEQRAVLAWLVPQLVRVHRGRSVQAGAGLWLAEGANGVLLAAYELHPVAQRLLPASMGAHPAKIRHLSGAPANTHVIEQHAADAPRSVNLAIGSRPRGQFRWYYVWAPGAPAAWTGSSADVRAVVGSACSHYALGAPAAERTDKHTVNVAALLQTHTGAATLLAGDTVAVVVLVYDEIDTMPPTTIASLTAEPGVVLPNRRRPAATATYRLDIAQPPAPLPGDIMPALAWRKLVGASLIIVHQAPPPVPRLQLTGGQPTNTYSAESIARMRATIEFTPPPPDMRSTDAPPTMIPFGIMLYRLWISRRNAVRMFVAAGGDAAKLGALNLTQLAAQHGLHQSIVSTQAALWVPATGDPCIIAPYELEQMAVFGADGLSPAFVQWLPVIAATQPIDTPPPDVWGLRALAATLPDATLAHLMAKYADLVSTLRYEHGQRQLSLWLVSQTQTLDAPERPIMAMLDRLTDAPAAYVRERLAAYARAAVQTPNLRYPVRSGESPATYMARLTCDMLQPALVANVLDGAEAHRIRALPTLPIELFPAHWTLPDLYGPLRIGQRRPVELCAAYYENSLGSPGAAYRESCQPTAPFVGILQLASDQPVRQVHEQRQQNYAAWKRAFDAQIDAAYVFTPPRVPKRALTSASPSVAAFVLAADALPLSVDQHRRLVAERAARLQAIAPHEQAIAALHAPDHKFSWDREELAQAGRDYLGAYAQILHAYADLDLDASADLTALAAARAALDAAVEQQLADDELRRRQAAMRLIAASVSTLASTSPAGANPPAAQPRDPFGTTLRSYAQSLPNTEYSRAVWFFYNISIERLSRDEFDDAAEPTATIRQKYFTMLRELPPPPGRMPTRRQLRQRLAHLTILLGKTADFDSYNDYENRAVDDAMAAFRAAVDDIELPRMPVGGWTATILAEHRRLWARGMRAALGRLNYSEMLRTFLIGIESNPVWFQRDPGQLPPRLAELQADARFFRPHPREACFLSAAINTFVGTDIDETRDTTSLQRAVWSDRLDKLQAAVPSSLAWTPDEKRQMILRPKTPEMLARIAVRWAVVDFVYRGPETRFIVPAQLLDRLLMALVVSPTMFDALERHGLDPTLPVASRISHKLVAVWRTNDPFVTIDGVDAGIMVAAAADEAPLAMAPLRALAKQLEVAPEQLWRHVLFGAATSVGLVGSLDTRDIAELALFVVELDKQVTAAIKSLDKETAALFDAVNRVALMHTCFSWHVGYLLAPQASRRIFVRQRHPDGRLVFDDFCSAVVPIVMRDIFGVTAVERTPIDADWDHKAARLLSGFVYGGDDSDDGPKLAQEMRRTIETDAIEQSRLLWRVRSHDNPMLPSSDLLHGTVSCWLRPDSQLRDASPMAGIDRTPAADEGLIEGRDIAYHEENNLFVFDSNYAYYDWRVGLDCFLSPEKARRNSIAEAPPIASAISLSSTGTPSARDVLTKNAPIDLWPLTTGRLQRFERWAALGWRRLPSKAAAIKAWDSSHRPDELNADVDTASIDDTTPPQSQAVIMQIRTKLASRLRQLIEAEEAQLTADGRLLINPTTPPAVATKWTDDGTVVLRSTRELIASLETAPIGDYTDTTHATEENRVATVEQGIGAYSKYYRTMLDAVFDTTLTMPIIPPLT